ncbi:TPA: CS1 type fimbrial major subunit [Salmonella enterica subsp. enterica serovar Muenchen]
MKHITFCAFMGISFIATAATAATPATPATGSANINVTADVDPSLALLSSDNTSLKDISLAYIPSRGLQPGSEQVRIASNDNAHGVEVTLSQEVQLINAADPAMKVPMVVTLGSNDLVASKPASFGKELFTNGETSPLTLTVVPKGKTDSLSSGHYSGAINLVLAQSTN